MLKAVLRVAGLFDHRKACRRLVGVRKFRLDHRKACIRLVEVWRVRFDHRKVEACKSSESPF